MIHAVEERHISFRDSIEKSHQPTQVIRSSEWALNALWNDAPDKRCQISLVDTVLFHDEKGSEGGPRPTRWLFTAKNGTIARKKDENLKLKAIRERFIRIALGNPRNQARHVAWVFSKNGSRKLLDRDDFERCLSTISSGNFRTITGLQCYVVPKGGEQGFIRASFELDPRKGHDKCHVARVLDQGEAEEISTRLKGEVEGLVRRIVKYIDKNSHVQTLKLSADFVIDDQHHIWLLQIPQAVTQTNQTQSLPDLNLSGRNDTQFSVSKCRGEFCTSSLSQLPGLCSQITEEDEGEDSNNASEAMGTLPSPQAKPPSRHRVLTDTGQRFQIGYKNVLLARAEMPFLMGQVTGGNVAKRWQQMDSQYRSEFGRTNPNNFYKQITVCSNCYSLYSKLNRFRKDGFTHVSRSSNAQSTRNAVPREEIVVLEDEEEVLATPETHTKEVRWNLPDNLADETTAVEEATPKKKNLKKKKKLKSKKATTVPVLKEETMEIPTPKVDEREINELRQVNETLDVRMKEERNRTYEIQSQVEKLTKKLAESKREFTTAMTEKDAYFRRQLLQIEQKHVQELAASARRSSTGEMNDSDKNISGRQELIDNIESLNRALDNVHLEREKEKQRMILEHQKDMERLTNRYKAELDAPRLQILQQEDRMELMKTEIYELEKRLNVASNLANESSMRVKLLEHERDELETQLKKSANASSSAASEANAAQDAESRVLQVQFEAKEKQLLHRIEYLKAQVVSETKCKEELGGNVAALTATIENAKREKKLSLAQLEQKHQRALSELESRLKDDVSQAEGQLASYKNRVAQLQTNMTELIQDAAMAKKKEETANMSSDKMANENAQLLKQNVELQSTIEELQDAMHGAKNSLEEANKSTMEATLRRLDNERQYLHSQLTTETKCKQELEKSTLELRKQIENVRTNSHEKLAEQEKISKATIDSLTEQLRHAKENVIQLESEVENSKRHFNDTRSDYFSLKEKARVHQTEYENARAELGQLKQKLIQAKEETLRERKHAKDSSERQSASLSTVKASIDAMSQSKDEEIQLLQQSLDQQLEKLAQTQGCVQELQDEIDRARKTTRTVVGAERIAGIMERRHERVKVRAFDRFVQCFAISTVRHQARQEQESELASQRKSAAEQQGKTIQLLSETYKSQLETELQKQKDMLVEQSTVERERIAKEYQVEIKKIYATEREKYESDLAQVKSEYENRSNEIQSQASQQLEATVKESQEKIVHLENKLSTLQVEKDQELTELQEIHTRELTKAVEMEKETTREQLKEAADQYEMNLKSVVDQHAVDLKSFAEEAEKLRKQVEKDAAERLNQSLVEKEMNAKEQFELEKEELLKQHELDIQHMKTTLERENTACLESDREHWQSLVKKEQETAIAKIKAIRVQLQTEKETELESCRIRMNEIKGNAMMQCAAKWQRALEEMTERNEIEKKTSYEQGIQDRESEWQLAANEIKQQQEEEMEKMKMEAQEAIRLCEEKYQVKLELESKQIRASIEREMIERLNQQEKELTTEFESQLQSLKESHQESFAQVKSQAEVNVEEKIAQLNQEHEDAVDDLKLEMNESKEIALATMEDEWREKISEMEQEERERIEQMIQNVRSEAAGEKRKAIEDLRVELQQNYQQELIHVEENMKRQTDIAVAECSKQKAKEQALAVQSVQDQFNKRMEKAREDLHQAVKQSKSFEEKFAAAQMSLEAAEDLAFDHEEDAKKKSKQYVFQLLCLLTTGSQKVVKLETKIKEKENEAKESLKRLEEVKNDEIDDVQSHLHQMEQFKASTERLHSELHETLVNYKREALLDHKVASNVLVGKIREFGEIYDREQENKATIEQEVSIMEAGVQELEEQIRQTSLESSVKGGRVNAALAAKKRRLHEEFETMLEAIEQKRDKITEIQDRCTEIGRQRSEKEGELKDLERKLVQVLVEQQKRMLQLLNKVRD